MPLVMRVLAVVFFGGWAAAQVSPVPGTGCPGAVGSHSGRALPGTTFVVEPGCVVLTSFAVLGAAGGTPVPVDPLVCGYPLITGCTLYPQPPLVVVIGGSSPFGAPVMIPIPSTAALVGLTFAAQGGCLGPSCLDRLTEALDVTIG
ncbi:MAG: hypothetical protein AAF628_13065 [Planctomycetota bacterium]